MPDEQQFGEAGRLEAEARRARVAADAAQKRETSEANDPAKAKRWKDAVADSEKPERRAAHEREAFTRSPEYKAAREHCKDVLLEVREVIAQMRKGGVDTLPAEDRADLIHKVGVGVSSRMAEKLRAHAERALDIAGTTGDLAKVDECLREGTLLAAGVAPYNFVSPEATTYDPAALVAQMERF